MAWEAAFAGFGVWSSEECAAMVPHLRSGLQMCHISCFHGSLHTSWKLRTPRCLSGSFFSKSGNDRLVSLPHLAIPAVLPGGLRSVLGGNSSVQHPQVAVAGLATRHGVTLVRQEIVLARIWNNTGVFTPPGDSRCHNVPLDPEVIFLKLSCRSLVA